MQVKGYFQNAQIQWCRALKEKNSIEVILHTVVGHIFLVFTPKIGFVKDFWDILTNNKFNKKFGAITPTPYLNSLIPNYLITLINTLLKNKSAAKVSGTDL